MYHTVVGQILAINEEETPKVITLETPRGDIVYFRYGRDAIGSTPLLGGVYTVSYQVDAGILRVVEIRKPEPGQYRAEFDRGPGIQKGADFEQPFASTSSYPPRHVDPIFERRTPRTTPEDFAPTTSITKGVRPDGLTLIVVMLFLISSLGSAVGLLLMAFIYTAFIGIIVLGLCGVALLLTIGLWTYREWARTGVIILSVLICFTIVGIFVGGPIIWYLEQNHIKKMFVY
ncbi:MAG: hypothetical protein P1Q69_11205 [Candidatus Thorarchaeota archaeon]|nr:hypothetical protein [Candidatus Thorarchaeota archaeon]